MEQRITITQLKSLSKKSRRKLEDWYYDRRKKGDLVTYEYPGFDQSCKWKPVIFGLGAPQGDPLPLLSIGQMIEFLATNGNGVKINVRPLDKCFPSTIFVKKLRDDLWEAVKEALEEN